MATDSFKLIIRKMRSFCLAFIVVTSSCVFAFGQCKTIDAEAKVTDTQGGSKNGKIVFEIKSLRGEGFTINVFGPNGFHKIGLEKKELENLTKGKYLIVIASKREEDNYCPKSIDVTIN
jgi:hypothetical protein